MRGTTNNRRRKYLVAFILIFLIEVSIALWVHDRIIRPYIGDALAVVFVYCFVRIFLPDGIRRLPLYVFLFAAFVEVMQYFRLVELLGLERCRVARIILGSVFDWKDILCYGLGCLVLYWLEKTRVI